jgi:hypothetical protein
LNTNKGTEDFLLQKYGPLLSLVDLASLLSRSVNGLRLSLANDSEMAKKFNPARKKIGRRVYFSSAKIGQILDSNDE